MTTTLITQSGPIEPETDDIVEELPTLTKGRSETDGPITAGIFRLAAKAAELSARADYALAAPVKSVA